MTIMKISQVPKDHLIQTIKDLTILRLKDQVDYDTAKQILDACYDRKETTEPC